MFLRRARSISWRKGCLCTNRKPPLYSSKGMETTAVMSELLTVPENLDSYLKIRANFALETWKLSLDSSVSKEAVLTTLVDCLKKMVLLKFNRTNSDSISSADLSSFRQLLVKESIKSFEAMRILPGEIGSIDNFAADNFLEEIVNRHEKIKEDNKLIFSTLENHHTRLARSYKNQSPDEVALADYSKAASAMGQKVWVIELNDWIGNFAVSFFKRGGAKRSYVRQITRKKKDTGTAADFTESSSSYLDKLMKNLRPNSKLRVLDVGNLCHNCLSPAFLSP